MATLDYIDVPPGATRLRVPPPSDSKDRSANIRPAPKIVTSIPQPSPPPSRKPSLLSSTAISHASSSVSFIPQMLLSAALPPNAPNPNPNLPPMTTNPEKSAEPILLSSKDPLSVPIMTTNFKRFVTVIGPLFWLQDRVEEILLWKKGWLRTAVWMAAYAFLCFYPRLILLLPHIALISIILATYPYPTKPEADPLYSVSANEEPAEAPAVAEGSVPWQANIQAIQNLMGAMTELHDFVEPHIYHLRLTPAHISTTRPRSSTSSASPRSPYTAHILTLLVLSFFPLVFIIHLPWFPLRAVCLYLGLAPFLVTHPYTQALMPGLVHAVVNAIPALRVAFYNAKARANSLLGRGEPGDKLKVEEGPPVPLSMILQRAMDDDRLSDDCWNSEMREVQLWENERFGGLLPSDSPTMVAKMAASSSMPTGPSQKGWSKENLRPGERTAWTRGRDGWSGVGSGGETGSGIDGAGEVSSNLTFSLAPGWAFVESEDWRKDVQCAWSGCGGDPEGWVYTNDAWVGPRLTPYTSGGGSVTRRRRWVRRVWYDPKRASADG